MTELSFLIRLLLDDRVSKEIREILADRITEVEKKISMPSGTVTVSTPGFITQGTAVPPQAPSPLALMAPQAPSTLALMAKHGDIPPIMQEKVVVPPPPPVEQIAQTQVTIAAVQSRQAAINAATSGKIDKVAGKPRKW